MTEPLIKIRNLHKYFGDHHVLRGVDLDIMEGRITTVIGGSGSGKSVLIKHIIGLLQPDEGTVEVEGQDLSTLGPRELAKVRQKFGMLFQNAALFDSMNVLENVAFPLREQTNMRWKEIKRIVNEKLEMLNLPNVGHLYPAELSGGMRKRVGLARAIVLEPKIIIYDEPTTGLDPIMIASVDDMIAETQRLLNITSIIISHDMASTFRIAHDIAMIHQGEIRVKGTPDDLKESDDEIVRKFIYVSGTGPLQRGEAAP